MKRKGFAAVIILLCLTASADAQVVGQDAPFWDWTEPAPHHSAVVKVDTPTSMGAGILIEVDKTKPIKDGFEGYVLTALHTLEEDNGRREISVTYTNGRVVTNCMIVAINVRADLVLLWVWAPADITPAVLSTTPAKFGDKLEICGLGGVGPDDDIVTSMRHFWTTGSSPCDPSAIYTDGTLTPGDSGGPVFNADGHVVGIIHGGWFDWNEGIKTSTGAEASLVWPAVASNVTLIQELLTKPRSNQVPLIVK